MIFIHKRDVEVFGYSNKEYNYFCKNNFDISKSAFSYNWEGFVIDGTLKQLAPTNLWRWG